MNTEHFKHKLEDERKLLENELKTVGRKNPSNPSDWEPTPGETDAAATEPDERADKLEQFGENAAILDELEVRWNNVKRALKKIEDGAYGTCEISGEPIEEERLEVNPAARTCTAHMEQEKNLPL